MPENKRVGPCYVFVGDPTQEDGATGNALAMSYLGKTRGDVTVNPNVEIAVGRVDQVGTSPLADSVFFSGLAPVVSVPMVDEDKDKLKEIFSGSAKEENGGLSAIGFGSTFKKIALSTLKTVCLLPVQPIADYGNNGIDNEDAIWLPRAVARNYGTFTFNLPEGDDVLNARETQFTGLYTDEDQSAVAIPESMRVMFQGSPTAGSLSWFLPDLSSLSL